MLRRTLTLLLALSLSGCFLPSVKNARQEAKYDKIAAKATQNTAVQLEIAKGYNYGVSYALAQDPAPNVYTRVAYDLSERSLLITGQPAVKEAAEFRNIVNKAVSTNIVDNLEAERLLSQKDHIIAKLQADQIKYAANMDRELDKWKADAAYNADKADFVIKWTRRGKFILWVGLGMFIFRIVTAFLPPPYNGISFIFDYVFGTIFKMGARVLPKAIDAAEVVSKKTYEVSRDTLETLVLAVQEARDNPALKKPLDEILSANMKNDVAAREAIVDVKKSVGLV